MTLAMLFDEQDMVPVQTSKKGLVLELFQIQSSAAVPWANFLSGYKSKKISSWSENKTPISSKKMWQKRKTWKDF